MENNPVVVLTGAGGVGKTTIARNFLNKTLGGVSESMLR